MDIAVVKGFLFAVILIVAGYIDIKTRTIPDWIHILIMLVALIKIDLIESLIGLVVVPLPFFIMACLKENSIGGGDVKLVGACGFTLGITLGVLGSIIGLIIFFITVCILSVIDKNNIHNSFPLVPFLGLGYICVCYIRIWMV